MEMAQWPSCKRDREARRNENCVASDEVLASRCWFPLPGRKGPNPVIAVPLGGKPCLCGSRPPRERVPLDSPVLYEICMAAEGQF